MTTIYLIRHTQTVGNIEKRLTGHHDYEVTKEGQKYIDMLTERLKNIKFDVAYASTLKRTSKTIAKLAQINNLPIIEEKDLCEMYFGDYDGMTWEEVNRINPSIRQKQIETNEIMTIKNQESTEEVANRMYNIIKKIATENADKKILIGSHGVAMEAFLRKVSGVPFIEQREEYSQKNTCVNIVEYDEKTEKFCIKLLNSIEHIKEKNERER